MGHEFAAHTYHRARKNYACEGRRDVPNCPKIILEGQRYLLSKLPPGHDVFNNDRWVKLRYCRVCAAHYGHPIPDEEPTP